MKTKTNSEKFMDTPKESNQTEQPKSVLTLNQMDSMYKIIGWIDENNYVIHYTDGTTSECGLTRI